ncbi:MAG: SUF system NifU family Fe-S cluster assembly protein [Candidatus Omnitrophica bacterium]|nr:SUF system NifU family Fe-S cluster assembly protein [Candidatus Omnitrophota bacterium]
MSLTDDLYREIILEHFKNPRNHGRLERPDLTAQGANPFCGDELELTLALDGERLREIRADGKGCSISQASASMMTEAVKGKTLEEAQKLAHQFKATMLEGAPMNLPPELEDLESLEGVKKYPVRIKCAILSWNTLLEGIEAHRRGKPAASHVEGEEGERPDLTQQMTTPAAEQEKGPAAEGLEEQVQTALKSVIDPELNMNVVDLGLIYQTDIREGRVRVVYTLTSPGCPLGPVIKGQVQSALTRIPWVKEVQTDLVWTPPWDPHTMASEEAKMELGIW